MISAERYCFRSVIEPGEVYYYLIVRYLAKNWSKLYFELAPEYVNTQTHTGESHQSLSNTCICIRKERI